MICLVVAMAENRVIGVENRLPWHIPGDLKRFKQITSGHPVLMGRKTFESIGRPLPNRTNILITRQKDYRAEGAAVCFSLEEALDWARRSPGANEIFVIGGAEIFRQALPLADRIYLTVVEWPFEGDTHMPTWDEAAFREVSAERISEDPPARLLVLERKRPNLEWQGGKS